MSSETDHSARAMQATQRFSLRELPQSHPERDWKRLLLLDGAPTTTVLNGIEISGQYSCGKLFVVATDYDYMDGVNRWFYLLDDQAYSWDQVAPLDYPGFIEQVVFESPTRISFGFFASYDRWALAVCEAGIWRSVAKSLLRALRTGRLVRCTHRLTLQRVAIDPRFQ